MTSTGLSASTRFDVRMVDHEFLLYDGELLHLLAGPAARVYALVDGVRTAEDIAQVVADGHPGRPEVALDVAQFVEDLLLRGILVAAGGLAAGYRIPPAIGWVRDTESVLLVDMTTGRRRALTPTAGRIWEAVDEHGCLRDVIDDVRARYADAPTTLSADVQRLLDELVDAGFLLPHPPRSAL